MIKKFSIPVLGAENNQQDSDEVECNIINEAKRLWKEYNNGKISREEYREKLNTLWTDAADRFDTIPEGENATEEIPVPKKVSSAEGRGHIQSLFRKEDGSSVEIRYKDEKRIQDWLNVNRLQLPLHSSNMDSNNSILPKSDTVNTNSTQDTKNYSSNDKKFSIPMLGAENDINSNFYQEYLEDMPIDEYNKLTVKKPIKVTKDIYAAVSSARMQLYGDSEVEDIPIIDIINLGEYGVLNRDDFYYIRNANKIDYSIIKHTKTLKGRKNKKDDIRRRQKGNSTYRGIDREDGRIRTERENDRSNRNNRPFADKSAPGKNAGETQFVEETDRRVGISDSTADIGRGIENKNQQSIKKLELIVMAVQTPSYWKEEKYQPLIETETVYGNRVLIPKLYEEHWKVFLHQKDYMLMLWERGSQVGYLKETSDPRKKWAVDLTRTFLEVYKE